MQELADSERLLRAFPGRSLSIARASDARFSPGYLRQERRFVIIRALLALDRRAETVREVRRSTREDRPGFPYTHRTIAGTDSSLSRSGRLFE
jgi:hypothetical protein